MGLISKIAGYFFGIIIVLVGLLWITSTMTISVILVGLIGLLMVIVGFGIIKYASAYKISIQTKINYFNKIYLSHSGITKDRTLEFRIFI